MILLVTDTSGKNGSVALARAEDPRPDRIDMIEEAPLAGGTFSAQLVPQVAAILANHGVKKTDIDAFVVVSGPGSFTGLRVGLAAIKALAEILRKPIVPISLLEVVALTPGADGLVLAALDAGRGEIFAGEYEVQDGSAQIRQERLLPIHKVLSEARGMLISTSHAPLAALARDAAHPMFWIEAVTAGMIARLGSKKLQLGETVDPGHLEANYMRRSDADIFAKPSR